MSKNKPVTKPTEVDGEEEVEGDDSAITSAFLKSLAVIALLVVAGGAIYYWMTRVPKNTTAVIVAPPAAPKARTKTVAAPNTPFVDITESSGVDFQHFSGAEGEKLLPETMGSGCAAFDYDNDGDIDLFFVNSCRWSWSTHDEKPTCRLYQNNGKAAFTDVSKECGLDLCVYGMGCAVGDFDNDGWADLCVSTVGTTKLMHNEQGKFRDVSEEAGVSGSPEQFASSAGFFDYDNDGQLDLVVCNYIKWSRELDLTQNTTLDGKSRAYGPPTLFAGTYSRLYHNIGQGKFDDVTEKMGLEVKNPNTGVPQAKSLGLALCDFDEDGWVDIMTANDTVPNILLHNEEGKVFREIGQQANVAFDNDGRPRGAMGIDVADFRRDGSLAIAIGNYANEMTSLYVSQKGDRLAYSDEATGSGLGPLSRTELKFAVLWLDYDLDGNLDLLSANGHLEEKINRFQESQFYRQPPHLYWNTSSATGDEFVKATTDKTGEAFHEPIVGRGAAYADLDGDGDLDIVLTNNGGRPRILRNDQELGHHWLRVKLVGVKCNRDAIGARVELKEAGGSTQVRFVSPTRGYLSSVEPILTFGLGDLDHIDEVVVHWPGGGKQTITSPAVDQAHVITQDGK